MASLIQGLRNFKANIGTAASEMQHIANQLQGSGADEKKFLEAVAKGEVQVAANLLTVNPNVIYARTKDWLNAWHVAAQAGSIPMLEVLYTHGRGATRKPLPGEPPHYAATTRDKRETPLMLACANTHLTAMHYLLGVGASPRETDKYGNTILHYAALKGQVKMLSILLASDEGRRQSETGSQGLGIGKGLSLNSPNTRLLDMRNEAGLQPLHFAVWGGQKEAVKTLLQHRPDLIAKSTTDSMAQVTCNGGSTPLHVAALRNDPALVDLLLNEYITVTNDGRGPRQDPRLVQDNYKFTPHGLAMDLKREAVLPLLDSQHVLKGLDIRAAAAAAAGVAYVSQHSFRRSITGGRSSRGSSDPGVKDGKVISVEEDGFAALAAGLDKQKERNRRISGSDSPVKVLVPPLQPPPPSSAKVRKAAGLPPRPLSLPCSPTSSPCKPLAGALVSPTGGMNDATSTSNIATENTATEQANSPFAGEQKLLTAAQSEAANSSKEENASTTMPASPAASSKPVVAVRAAAAAAAAQHYRTAVVPITAQRSTDVPQAAAVPAARAPAAAALSVAVAVGLKKMSQTPATSVSTPTSHAPAALPTEGSTLLLPAQDQPSSQTPSAVPASSTGSECHNSNVMQAAVGGFSATANTSDQAPPQGDQQDVQSVHIEQHMEREYSLMLQGNMEGSADDNQGNHEQALAGQGSAGDLTGAGDTAAGAENAATAHADAASTVMPAGSYCSSYVAVDAAEAIECSSSCSSTHEDIDGKVLVMSNSSNSQHTVEHSEPAPYGMHVITPQEIVMAEAYHTAGAHSVRESVDPLSGRPSSEAVVPDGSGSDYPSLSGRASMTNTSERRSHDRVHAANHNSSNAKCSAPSSTALITPKASLSSQGSGDSGSHVSSQGTTSSSAARAAAAASVVVVEPVTPLELTCPITNQLFEHPVIAEDGRAYEAEALEMWFTLSDMFPATGLPIITREVKPAPADLLQRITDWRAAHVCL